MKRALITGVTGQDGSHLSDFLLEKGYEVYGLVRRTANTNLQRISHLLTNDNFHILYGDLTDQSSILSAIQSADPDEFYNLGAMSFVGESWNQPALTASVTGMGVLNCLEAIRISGKKIKFYQAGSSEMFGKVLETPQKETTRFNPRSPYGVAKVFGHYMTKNYRESYNMFCCNGILFNHEGERRGEEFVTRKISKGVAEIKMGIRTTMRLGNLDAKRDWGHSKDYVRSMWMMMQRDVPDDYVVCTGETHSVREFLDVAFKHVGIDDWGRYVSIDKAFIRPSEVDILLGDYSKIKDFLGWEPEIDFETLVKMMVDNDLELLKSK